MGHRLHDIIKWPQPSLARIVRQFADETPDYNARAFRGERGFQTGRIGELVVMDYLKTHGVAFEQVYSTAHDIVVRGKRWEIKTKERSVPPRVDFSCTIPDYNADHQDADVYCFVSLVSSDRRSGNLMRFSDSYILGAIERDYFHEICTTHDPDDEAEENGWTPTVRCHNVPVSALTSLKFLTQPTPAKENTND